MAQKFNIHIDKGSYFEAVAELKHGNNAPVDLTGYTFYSGLKYNYSSNVILEFDIASATPNTGIFTYSLASNATLDIRTDNYHYDIFINDGSEYYKIIEGVARISDKATDYESP